MGDRFVEFVDRLAADLDAIPDRAQALAAEAHLSRFHFERVITALAGESPTRFRSRIPLERAAYRMITGDAILLDIAVDAGFSSHEAFTRAFRRPTPSPPPRGDDSPPATRSRHPAGCTSTRPVGCGCRPGTGWTAWTSSSRWSSTTCG